MDLEATQVTAALGRVKQSQEQSSVSSGASYRLAQLAVPSRTARRDWSTSGVGVCSLPGFLRNEPVLLRDELQMKYVLVWLLSFVESLI